MTGTVIHVLPIGVDAKMSSTDAPTGSFQVVSQTDKSVIGTVKFFVQGPEWSRFKWTSPTPTYKTQVGDTLQPIPG
jgi:hypothetical protein